MATIRPRTTARGTVVYHVQVRLKGCPPQTATFARLTDARRWAQRTEALLREGRHFPGSVARRTLMAEVLTRYQETVLPHKRPRTVTTQRQQLAWWQARIGHLRLCDVTPAVITQHRDVLAQAHAPATVRRYLALLSHVFSVAVREWQLLDDNPVRRVSKPREPQGRVRYLNDAERQRLLDAC